MISNNFKKIVIGEEGLSLKYNNNETQDISFSDINKIYIKGKKVPVKYLLLFVGVSLSIVLLLLWIYEFHLVAFSPFFLILVGVIKWYNYKIYFLNIKLKNGSRIIQPIPLKSKNKTIEDIYIVRKVLLRKF